MVIIVIDFVLFQQHEIMNCSEGDCSKEQLWRDLLCVLQFLCDLLDVFVVCCLGCWLFCVCWYANICVRFL